MDVVPHVGVNSSPECLEIICVGCFPPLSGMLNPCLLPPSYAI